MRRMTRPYRTKPVDPRSGDLNRMLSIDDLAALLGVAKHVIYRWRRQREGPASYRFGNTVRYRQSDVTAWLEERQQSAAG